MNLDVEPKTVMQAAYVLVLDSESRALVVWSNTYGGYTLPGGKVEPEDPSVEYAAVRELAEEAMLVAQLGALALLHKAQVRFRPKAGHAIERETYLFHAQRVTGRAAKTGYDRPLAWLDYTQLVARAPAFFADFYKAAPPLNVGFFLKPTEGV